MIMKNCDVLAELASIGDNMTERNILITVLHKAAQEILAGNYDITEMSLYEDLIVQTSSLNIVPVDTDKFSIAAKLIFNTTQIYIQWMILNSMVGKTPSNFDWNYIYYPSTCNGGQGG